MANNKKHKSSLILFFIALQFQIMIAAKALNIVCAYILYSRRIFDINFSGFVFFLILMTIETALEIGITILLDFHQLKPSQEVIAAADKIAEGDYSARVNIKGAQVFNDLGASFNHMAEELGSVEMLRRDFVNNMSHEFKTPIAAISGFANMLKRTDLTEEERTEYLDVIISESERLTNLSTNILNLSKLENQSTVRDKTNVDVTEELRLAVALLENKIEKKHISVECNDEEIYAYGNKELLKQVWINLLDNAIKFSPENGKIGINVSEENSETVIRISNNGEPISLSDAERIFNKFYRSEKNYSVSGNGLGLTIVKRIADLHGGSVAIVKSDEESTVFEVRLKK